MIKILVVGMITLSLPFVILGFLFEAIVSSFRAGQSFYTDLLLAAKR